MTAIRCRMPSPVLIWRTTRDDVGVLDHEDDIYGNHDNAVLVYPSYSQMTFSY